ncbi:MAG: hypothetical protein PHS92_03890 [Candidatus Gracilibacteria bacterium]|nr:hypothetical protein [Candidatus Gracilibacteria bacterium]
MVTINCGLNENEDTTYFMQLSYNDEGELFFRPLWGDIRPTYYFDGFNNEEFDIYNIDHISFHKDGTIHTRYFDDQRKKEKILDKKLENSLGEMGMDYYAPLLAFSIYDIRKFIKYIGKKEPLIFGNNTDEPYIWDISGTNQISFVFFLVGGNVNHEIMLETYFPNIFNIKASPLLLNYFGKEDKIEFVDGLMKVNAAGLLVACTTRIITSQPERPLLGQKYLKTISNTEAMMGITITPGDKRIASAI